MAIPDNPRFPHHCKIYRLIGEDSFSDGEELVIYEGECRKDAATTMREYLTNGILKSDYRLSIPGQVAGILRGDFIDVTDLQCTLTRHIIGDAHATNLGTTLHFNAPAS